MDTKKGRHDKKITVGQALGQKNTVLKIVTYNLRSNVTPFLLIQVN